VILADFYLFYRRQVPQAFGIVMRFNELLDGKLLFTLYPEHLGSAYGAYTLSCRLPVLHSYGFSILHFSFSTALHAVCLH